MAKRKRRAYITPQQFAEFIRKINSVGKLRQRIKAIQRSLEIARSEQYECDYMGDPSPFYQSIIEGNEEALRIIETRIAGLSPAKQYILKPLIAEAWDAGY